MGSWRQRLPCSRYSVVQSVFHSHIMKTFLVLLFAASTTLAVKLDIKPFQRLIPADVLRDFRDSCFASTKCKVYGPGEGWSLAPFCGASKCVKLESGRLAEEVTDWARGGPEGQPRLLPGQGRGRPQGRLPRLLPGLRLRGGDGGQLRQDSRSEEERSCRPCRR